MFVFRLLAVLLGIGIVASMLAFLASGKPVYLRIVKKLLLFAVVAALTFFVLLISERILLPVVW